MNLKGLNTFCVENNFVSSNLMEIAIESFVCNGYKVKEA